MTCKQSKSAYRVGKRIGAKQKHQPQYTTETQIKQYGGRPVMNKYDPTESDTCRAQIAATVAQIERPDKLQAIHAYAKMILNFTKGGENK